MRTGKLLGQTKVMIPWEDHDGVRHWQAMSFNGDVYATKVYAEIRKYVKEAFGVDVDNDWLYNVPRIANLHDTEMVALADNMDKAIEEFIQRMELKDEAKDQPDTNSEGDSTGTPEEPLCTVPDQPEQNSQ